MPPLRILIVGSGIAGPTLAYFLSLPSSQNQQQQQQQQQPPFHITILERAPNLRTGGQNVDVRGAGLEVIRKMGLEAKIRASVTDEEGLLFVDTNNNIKATFPADKTGKTQTWSSDIEILRGRLAEILYGMTNGREGVEYIFGETIQALEQEDGGEGKVKVRFAKAQEEREFDVVVGADGLGSRTRALAFGEEESREWRKSLGMYTAFFAVPGVKTDDSWWRWYNAPGRRCVMTRPDNEGALRCFLSVVKEDPRLLNVLHKGMSAQKELMKEYFTGAGWELERILKGMEDAEDFYMDQVAQVKMPTWSKGRVTLLGDAGYCASLISGMGTTLSLCGAYVLAGELKSHPDDIPLALANYENNLRPLVTTAQKLQPGAPWIVNPETDWGIWFMNNVLGFVSWSGIMKVAMMFGAGPPAGAHKLEDYGFGEVPAVGG